MADNTHELVRRIHLVRRDVGNLLFHFTRTPHPYTPPLRIQSWPATAMTVLENILSERRLIGSSAYIRGGHKCVCFTEAPIGEVVSLFRLAELAAETGLRPKYEPFGVAVTKEWLFARGGRPVIYQPDPEYDALPEPIRYRHVRYDPIAGVDFTWEREWRICTEELGLDPKHTLVLVPSSAEAFDLMFKHADWQADYDREGNPENAYPEPDWMAVSLDFFGLGR
jgi:hypothetical protein